MRLVPGQDEGHLVAFGHLELADRRPALAAQWHGRVHLNGVRTADRAEAAFRAPHPRRDAAVIESNDQFRAHADSSAHAANQPHDVGLSSPYRHAVGERDRAGIGLERGVEHERVAAVRTGYASNWVGRGDEPPAVLGRAEQRREAGRGIEPGEAPSRSSRRERRGLRSGSPR